MRDLFLFLFFLFFRNEKYQNDIRDKNCIGTPIKIKLRLIINNKNKLNIKSVIKETNLYISPFIATAS